SQDLSGICEGTFCVTVTDAHQCTTSTCATVTHTVPPVIVLTPTHLVCYNVCTGAVNLTVVSGSSPFSYHWDNGATTEDLSGLCAGTYCVTVTDVNGCT